MGDWLLHPRRRLLADALVIAWVVAWALAGIAAGRALDKVSAVTFNTSSSGDATVRTAISAGMHWGACWVTKEKAGGPEGGRVVLRSA